MIQLHKFTFNPLEENCYVVWDDSLECAIVDPGCHISSEKKELMDFIDDNCLIPKLILLTHTHMDHVFGVSDLCAGYGIGAYMDPRETVTIMEVKPFDFTPVQDGMQLSFGRTRVRALSTPGHSAGGVCWWFEEDKVLFSGDALFKGCIGRTDLPGGDLDMLMNSLHNVLMNLDGDIDVYPGHGPATDIATERQTNPFLFDDGCPCDSSEDDHFAADGTDGVKFEL